MTVQLRVRRDAPHPTHSVRHRLDWDTDPDLSRFEELPEHEKTRVIIRVLCGLVALEETGTSLTPPTPPESTPRRRRLLPFLGYEDPPLGRPVLGAPVVDLSSERAPSVAALARVDA